MDDRLTYCTKVNNSTLAHKNEAKRTLYIFRRDDLPRKNLYIWSFYLVKMRSKAQKVKISAGLACKNEDKPRAKYTQQALDIQVHFFTFIFSVKTGEHLYFCKPGKYIHYLRGNKVYF